MAEEQRKDRLTTGWKILIVLGLFAGGGGAGRSQQAIHNSASEAQALRSQIDSLKLELSGLRTELDALKKK